MTKTDKKEADGKTPILKIVELTKEERKHWLIQTIYKKEYWDAMQEMVKGKGKKFTKEADDLYYKILDLLEGEYNVKCIIATTGVLMDLVGDQIEPITRN